MKNLKIILFLFLIFGFYSFDFKKNYNYQIEQKQSQWINITPNQISNGWSGAYSSTGKLIIYYQIWRSSTEISNGKYHYYIYFYSGNNDNAVALSKLSFYSDGTYVGGLENVIIPTKTLHIYSIYSSNPNSQIGFNWEKSILY